MADIERRFLAGDIRADADSHSRIHGYAIVFNVMSQDLGGFREIIKPEAVSRTLEEALDVRALVDHDSGKVIGRTRAGTLELRKDRKGLRVNIDTADTTAGRDVLVSVRRGDLSGMSFAFRTLTDEWRMEDGEAIREVLDMTISEVSIVSFPAYQQTSVETAQRSLQEFRAQARGKSIDWLRKVHRQRMAS
jgi:Escherichia/Staphylococcus phage prohead protease